MSPELKALVDAVSTKIRSEHRDQPFADVFLAEEVVERIMHALNIRYHLET